MKVRVRGGYLVEYQKKAFQGGTVIDVPEDFYRSRHQLFDVVVEDAPVVKEAPEVKAEAMAEEDVSNRAMKEPDLKRTRKKK